MLRRDDEHLPTPRSDDVTADGPNAIAGSRRVRPATSLRYPVLVRIGDAMAGWRDGRLDSFVRASLAGRDRWWQRSGIVADEAEGTAVAAIGARSQSIWLTRNVHTFLERDNDLFLTAQDAADAAVVELRGLRRGQPLLVQVVDAAREYRAALPVEPTPQELARRGPAEGFDSVVTVATRRRREHARILRAADLAVAQAERALYQSRERQATLRADLTTAFEAAQIRSERLRELHQRRASVFRRRYVRVLKRHRMSPSALAEHPISGAGSIAHPSRTTQPCPWLSDPAQEES